MNPRRVCTPLRFIACPLDKCTAHAMNRGRVDTPLGFIVCHLD